MTRTRFRWILLLLLAASLAFAGWAWLRPYEWTPDPAARGRIEHVQVTRDHSFFWCDVRVKLRPGQSHDLARPVRLVTASGKEHMPADTTLTGTREQGTTGIMFRFWLEAEDFAGPLKLELNGGSLGVRSGKGSPRIGSSGTRMFLSEAW